MSFFVIEGDNGTGKDTLAIKLQKNFGFRIVTNEEDIVQLNKEAKKYDGKKRVKKFLEYGRIRFKTGCNISKILDKHISSSIC